MNDQTQRPVLSIIDSIRALEGGGFPVRRPFPTHDLAQVDPFLLLDHLGPVTWGPGEGIGAPDHPHRGFETVTYLLSGGFQHKDSAGHAGKLGPGDVQWMTAGGGLVHEEKYSQEFSRRGGNAEMVQLWVNLPAKHKLTKPRYQDLRDSAIPKVELRGGGMARVIAGELAGARGPALTHTPVALWDLRLKEGRSAEFDFPEDHSVSLLVLKGGVAVNGGETAGRNELAVFHQNGRRVTLEAKGDSTVLLMSGEPIREPIAGYGPFVMNTKEEINDAMRDYASGKMGHLS